MVLVLIFSIRSCILKYIRKGMYTMAGQTIRTKAVEQALLDSLTEAIMYCEDLKELNARVAVVQEIAGKFGLFQGGSELERNYDIAMMAYDRQVRQLSNR